MPTPSSRRSQSASAPSESSTYAYSSAAATPRVGLNGVSRLSKVAVTVMPASLRSVSGRIGEPVSTLGLASRVQVADTDLGVVAQVGANVERARPSH